MPISAPICQRWGEGENEKLEEKDSPDESEGVWQRTPSHSSLGVAGSPQLNPESFWRDSSGMYHSSPTLDLALEKLDRNIEELARGSPLHAEEELWADRESDPR